MCWTPLYGSKHKQQTTGGKNEPSIVFLRKSERTPQQGAQEVNTHNRTTQKTKKMSSMDPIQKPGGIQSSPVNLMAVIEERKHLHKK